MAQQDEIIKFLMEKGFCITPFSISADRGKTHCKLCRKPFDIYKREHQCKRCFRPVCKECVPSRYLIFKPNGERQSHRCCSTCKSQIQYIQTLIVTQRISMFRNSGFGDRLYKRAIDQLQALDGQKIKQLARLSNPKIQKYKKLTANIKAEQLFGSLNPSMRQFIFLSKNSSLNQVREKVEQLNIALINSQDLNLSSQLFQINLLLLSLSQFQWAFTISRWIFRGLKELKSIKLDQHIEQLVTRYKHFSGSPPSNKIIDFIKKNISMLICTLLINCLKAQSLFVIYEEELQVNNVETFYRIAVIYLLAAKQSIERGEKQLLPSVFNEVRNGQVKAILSSMRKKVQFKTSIYDLQDSRVSPRQVGINKMSSLRFSQPNNSEGLSDSPRSRSVSRDDSRVIEESFDDDSKTIKSSRAGQVKQLIKQIVRVRQTNIKLQKQLEQLIEIEKTNCSCQTEQLRLADSPCQTIRRLTRESSSQTEQRLFQESYCQSQAVQGQFVREELQKSQTQKQRRKIWLELSVTDQVQILAKRNEILEYKPVDNKPPVHFQETRLQILDLVKPNINFQQHVLIPAALQKLNIPLEFQSLECYDICWPKQQQAQQLPASKAQSQSEQTLIDQLNQANLRCQYLKHRQAAIEQQVNSKNLQIDNLNSKLSQKQVQTAKLKTQFERLLSQFQQELGQDGSKPECKPF